MTPPTYLDRLMQGLRALVRAEVPRLSYLGLYEATVNAVAHDGSTADVTPTLTSLPPIPKVPLQSSILGEIVTIKVGATCLIEFVNGDPTKPILSGCAPVSQGYSIDALGKLTVGPSASSVALCGGTQYVARGNQTSGDVAVVFLPPTLAFIGTIGPVPYVPGVTTPNLFGTITIPSPALAQIMTGSALVTT